ncbi:hypothetical protein [Thermotoga sp. KOL6]|uniref:ornithine cyclodeaminase family domain n=1 Tax=Thermotoga sp. KOL6 TaxID=126741 RepID=UPI000C78C07B|nr:hypothetical protein [Thermotoga sp. KOL6]PLV60041.1 hypothetical protein AS005_01765 [Thermotoga sp. KOL6]
MEYKGRWRIFDTSRLKRYSLFERPSKVSLKDLVDLEKVKVPNLSEKLDNTIKKVAEKILEAKEKNKKILIISGAHIIKNGLGTFLIWLIKNGLVDHIAVNGAFIIHDLELALVGKTSESIPNALGEGKFGFAKETADIINEAINEGNKRKLGYGETIGMLLSDELTLPSFGKLEFPHKEISVVYNSYKNNVPLTVHIAIGADIVHMHPSFSGEAAGGCSARDFLILAETVSHLKEGVCILIGSQVIGVENFLKAVSMAANVGSPPSKLFTAVFDMKPVESVRPVEIGDERNPVYYFRDIKSVVVRIPKAFEGEGVYVQGDHRETLIALWEYLHRSIG